MNTLSSTWEGSVTLPDGYDRFVKRLGDGPEVMVCLNGGPGDEMGAYAPLEAMADTELQVVLYDPLDSGRSARTEREELWTVENFVLEVESLINVLDLGAVHLLGQSWGGMLALEFALHSPQLVKSLILCDTTAKVETAVTGMEEWVNAASDGAKRAVAEGREFDPDDDSPEGRGLIELYASHVLRCHPFELERSCDEFIEVAAEGIGELGPSYYVMWGPNEFKPTGPLRDWDITDRLGEIQIPSLVVCGAYDLAAPICSQEIVDGLPDARWLVLGQSSHMIFHEVEADVAMVAIRGFIKQNT